MNVEVEKTKEDVDDMNKDMEQNKYVEEQTSVEDSVADKKEMEVATEETAVEESVEEDAVEEVSEDTVEEVSEDAVEEVSKDAVEETSEDTEKEDLQDEDGEGTSAEEKKEKKQINKKALFITLGSVLGFILVVYLGFSLYFSKRFVFNTTVNGIPCSGKTVKQVEEMMQKEVEEYVLTLEERHGITEEINGKDIDIKYNNVDEIKAKFAKQNAFLWVTSIFEKNPISVKVDLEYDSKKLDAEIEKLECLKEEKQITPVSAKPIYAEGSFEIEEEVKGSLIEKEQLYKAIHESVANMEQSMDLSKKNCYVAPTFTKDSPEVIAAKDAMNKCLKAKITYSIDGIVVTVDSSQTAGWLLTNENMEVVFDEAQVRAFTDTLGNYFNTPNSALDLTTPTGKVVNIANARLGRVVGSAEECVQLMADIREGEEITREPIFSQGGTPGGEPVWGTTYLEVDISVQHMWYVVNGAVAFESDIVTGSPGRDTPAGVFTILEKKRNKVLTGNIVPSTGQPEYRTPVAYWMRVTWSGVGFHDATWQPAFGGQLYRQGRGSHGCINMPKSGVATLYDMVNVGCPVVIHY